MKEATSNFIKNATEVDKEITEEIWKDFLEQLMILNAAKEKISSNNTAANITNITQRLDNPECLVYCAGEFRNIFEQYKLYHGYVALIVC